MPHDVTTTFKGVAHFGETQLLSELENNLKYWLDWAFLSIGAWTSITGTVSDGYSGNPHVLRYVNDDAYTDGQVWQGVRKEWVWESGLDYDDQDSAVARNPVDITGVIIDGVGTDAGYHINYPLGRVVFDTAKSTSSDVQLKYSYRNVQVAVADNVSWWRELQLQSVRSDDIHFTQAERTGDWSIGASNRVQLPLIIVEAVPRGTSEPYEIGNSALIINQDVIFHVLTDDRNMRNKLVSILQVQNDKTIWLFDSNIIASGEVFPLDYRGTRVNNLLYPNLVSNTGYRWKKCMLKNVVTSEVVAVHPRLYEGTVRATLEIVFGSI